MRARANQCILDVQTTGMHCRSCELLVEQSLLEIPGVSQVQANADRNRVRVVCDAKQVPNPDQIASAITPHGYGVVSGVIQPTSRETIQWRQVAGSFIIVLLIGFTLGRLGLLNTGGSVGVTTGFFALFGLGLVAASSSCLAVSGGLMLSVVASVRERYPNLQGRARMIPVSTFVLGRIVGYTVFGALIALLGKALQPSPLVMGMITIVAALYMFIVGLDMLHLASVWLKRLIPRVPKIFSRRIVSGSSTGSWAAPFAFGALTFFLPCGFTQALQLYVLTTGSAVTGGLTMLAFALGTAPALLALGWATNVLKGKAGQFFFQLAGAAVILLGLLNISNGLTLTGHPLSFAFWKSPSTVQAHDPNVVVDDGVQVVKTSYTVAGYEPATFAVRANQPVRWEVSGAGHAGGCRSVLEVPTLGISQQVNEDTTTISFTPTKPGTYAFSCSMGMYRGSFTVTQS